MTSEELQTLEREETLANTGPFLIENIPDPGTDVLLPWEDYSLEDSSYDSYVDSSVWNPQDHWDDDIKSEASPEWTVSLEDKKWVRVSMLRDTSITQEDFDEMDREKGREPFSMLPTLKDYYSKTKEEWARLTIAKVLGNEKKKSTVVTVDTAYDITFAEEGTSSNKIPEIVNVPDVEPDLEESVLDDDDLSVFTSEEDSFFPELAAPAITSSEGEVATPLVGQDNYKLNPQTFLADSACSSRMGSCDSGMFDTKEEKFSVRIGDGKMLTSTKVGKKRVTVVQKDGTMTDIVLSPFKYVPGLWVNFFALLLHLTTRWLISNVGPVLTLKKDNTSITFDRIFATKNGFLGGVDMIAKEELANLCLQSTGAHDIFFLHKLFGHCPQDTIANTAKHHNLQAKARTPLEPCPMCKIANAVQTDVPKQTSTKATKPGG